jgi:hypothetical protein
MGDMFNPMDPFEGGRWCRNVTKAHRPLIWEAMSKTVYARDPLSGGIRHFEDYGAAREFVRMYDHTDLRISRVSKQLQGWPSRGVVALWGIPPKEFKE